MARLNRARLMEGVFPHRFEIGTRFGDTDVQGHINNVAMAAIFQEGRVCFSREVGLMKMLQGRSIVVASTTIDYVGEMHHPDPIELSVGVLDIGRTSYRLAQVARQNGQVGALAEFVLVARDGGAPTPLDDAWREKLEALRIR